MGVIVMVLTWPVTVMTDVIGVGVHVDLVVDEELDAVEDVENVGKALGEGVDVVDWDTGTGMNCVDAFAGVEVVVVSVVVSGVGWGVVSGIVDGV